MVTLLVQDSHSLGVKVNLLQDSSGIGIVDEKFGFLMVSELFLPLGYLLYSETWPHVGHRFIV